MQGLEAGSLRREGEQVTTPNGEGLAAEVVQSSRGCGGPSRCVDDLCRWSSIGLCGLSDDDFDDDPDIDERDWSYIA